MHFVVVDIEFKVLKRLVHQLVDVQASIGFSEWMHETLVQEFSLGTLWGLF